MEYYAGYLIPVPFDSDPSHKPCREAGKLRKRLKTEIGDLETRIRMIEGKLRDAPSGREESRREKRENKESRSLHKRKIRIVENEYADYNVKEENNRLREENRLLNEYFGIFSKKYRDNQSELEALRQENTRLNTILSRNTCESTNPTPARTFHQRSLSQSQSGNLDKYVYDHPPYEADQSSARQDLLSTPKLKLVKASEIQTKLTYEDSITDYALTSRSKRNNTVQSGLL